MPTTNAASGMYRAAWTMLRTTSAEATETDGSSAITAIELFDDEDEEREELPEQQPRDLQQPPLAPVPACFSAVDDEFVVPEWFRQEAARKSVDR